ncbi:MAG: hypothetical protein HFG39_04300 [Lachnospiraceae bacterium]|nr:hypothetical protein [Lachnospiraceae bacterium]
MDTSKEMTDFDDLICDNHLQMLKAAIPYMPAYGQQILSLYTKSLELSNTMQLLRRAESHTVGICSISENKRNSTELLNAIKKYCNDSERELLDLFMNFFSAFRMYNTYRELFPGEASPGDKDRAGGEASNPIETLKNMLSPEQKNMLDTYSSLLSPAK